MATVWLAALLYNLLAIRRAPWLPRRGAPPADEAPPHPAPLVSILVPARNEAGRILEASVRSMLAQDYPNFEVVAVDDRSTDATPEILAALADADARLRVVRGEPLPAGWIGKPWALAQASRAARGEWLLATDADMLFEPTVLRRAMRVALDEGYDAVTLMPAIDTRGFWAALVMPVAGWLIMLLFPFWLVNDPRSRVALGIGGFFLQRRSAHEAIGGYESMRDEVTEDLTTARRLKRAGFRLHLAAAPSLLWTPMYASPREIFEGFGKNAFAAAGGNLPLAVGEALLNLAFTLLPALVFVVSLIAGPGALTAAAGAAYLSMAAAMLPVYVMARTHAGYAFIGFLAHAMMAAVLLHSTWRLATGRGVEWKARRLYRRPKS